jgi:CHAD domain-containing protein
MDVTSDGKWFWVEPLSAPVAAAAERIVGQRLEDVQRFLPLAARHDAEDVEYVHQLRVSCRRAAAALRAFESFAPRDVRKLKSWLKRLRRAAGPARDADVFLGRLRTELDPTNQLAQEIVAVVVQSRIDAQRALVKVDAKAAQGGLKKVTQKCLAAFRKSDAPDAEMTFAEFAQEAIREPASGLHAVDAHNARLAELHALRIAGKRLRYALEIFHSAAADGLRLETYPQVEELQERLGAINDRVASQRRLQQWLAELPADDLAAFAAGLVVGEHAAAVGLRNQFLAWWTPERQAQLREQIGSAFV